jgi:hypothetical protein
VLGECDAGLGTNATCMLSSGDKTGVLSECTLEGVSSGATVNGISSTGEVAKLTRRTNSLADATLYFPISAPAKLFAVHVAVHVATCFQLRQCHEPCTLYAIVCLWDPMPCW